MRELRGVVERITFQNPENGYTVARLAPDRADAETEVARHTDHLVTLVGTLTDLTPGEAIVARGWWRNDPKHGWQFQAVDYRVSLPATLQGMKKYLGSGLIKGIGPVNAGRIVEAFGEATFAVIDETPQRLTEVPGIGRVRAERIAATWAEQRHIREVMATLQSYAVSTSLAVRIYKRYGADSGRILAQEPYRLAREVWGIGFKTADKIAQAVGIAPMLPSASKPVSSMRWGWLPTRDIPSCRRLTWQGGRSTCWRPSSPRLLTQSRSFSGPARWWRLHGKGRGPGSLRWLPLRGPKRVSARVC